MLFLYKYVHSFLYPSTRHQLFKRFFPSKNSSNTLHFFARLMGITIIFSEFRFNISDGIALALLDFSLIGFFACLLYIVSIYILDSISLYNFEYNDEILKRKNISYAIISFAQATALAYLIKTILKVSGSSILVLIFLWFFAIVLIGLALKSFSLISQLSFNRLLVQKNISVGLSYLGFVWGWSLIISSSLDHQVALDKDMAELKWYLIQVLLKIILSLIIIPIFKKGIIFAYKMQDDLNFLDIETKGENKNEFGYGVFEGAIFFTSCLLTTLITGNIYFGNFYPTF